MASGHSLIEQKGALLGILIAVAVSLGGLAEIIPLMVSQVAQEPAPGQRPYSALELEGRDIYLREGCYNCHSQQVRPFRSETERYGPYSVAGESVYDHPFQFGSKRTGPDLARVGGRYSDEWHRAHLVNPRDLVPESNMPGYPWLERNVIDSSATPKKLRIMQNLGVPYSDEDIAGAAAATENRTEMEAIIAYLQSLGHAQRSR